MLLVLITNHTISQLSLKRGIGLDLWGEKLITNHTISQLSLKQRKMLHFYGLLKQ